MAGYFRWRGLQSGFLDIGNYVFVGIVMPYSIVLLIPYVGMTLGDTVKRCSQGDSQDKDNLAQTINVSGARSSDKISPSIS